MAITAVASICTPNMAASAVRSATAGPSGKSSLLRCATGQSELIFGSHTSPFPRGTLTMSRGMEIVLTQPPTRSQLAMIIESVLNDVREPMASAPTRSIVKRSPIGGGVGVGPVVSPGSADSNPEKMSSTVLFARDVISAAPACGAAASNMAATMTSDTAARRSAPRAASRTTATRHGIIRSNRSVSSARRPAVANEAAKPTSPLEATPSKRRSATRRSGAAERRAARRRPWRS